MKTQQVLIEGALDSLSNFDELWDRAKSYIPNFDTLPAIVQDKLHDIFVDKVLLASKYNADSFDTNSYLLIFTLKSALNAALRKHERQRFGINRSISRLEEEFFSRVREVVDSIKHPYVKHVKDSFFHGKTLRVIAKEIGMTHQCVFQRVNKGLDLIKEKMSDDGSFQRFTSRSRIHSSKLTGKHLHQDQ